MTLISNLPEYINTRYFLTCIVQLLQIYPFKNQDIFSVQELENSLIPVLREGAVGGQGRETWVNNLVGECREAFSVVLPLKPNENEFLDRLFDHGEIDSTILTTDQALQKSIQKQPLLEWKAINVRKYKGLS